MTTPEDEFGIELHNARTRIEYKHPVSSDTGIVWAADRIRVLEARVKYLEKMVDSRWLVAEPGEEQ